MSKNTKRAYDIVSRPSETELIALVDKMQGEGWDFLGGSYAATKKIVNTTSRGITFKEEIWFYQTMVKGGRKK